MRLVDLRVYPRDNKGKNACRKRRSAGWIPGVLYGSGKQTTPIEISSAEFGKVLAASGGRKVMFSLKHLQESAEAIALLREMQRHPVSDQILHVDLFEIPQDQPITVPLPVQVSGESLAVKRGDATVAVVLDEVEVSCLPREMPDHVTVDISGLSVHDKVYVRDLTSQAGRIVSDPEDLVLHLRAPVLFVEEEAEAEEAPAEGEGAAAGEAKPGPSEGKGAGEDQR
jgi:large subunit ribosomal protein L25